MVRMRERHDVSMSNSEKLDRAIDDPSEWATPQRSRKSEKRQRGAVVSVRMTEVELEVVQEKAASVNKTVGTFMRESALQRQVSIEAPPVRRPFLFHASTAAPLRDAPAVVRDLPPPAPWYQHPRAGRVS